MDLDFIDSLIKQTLFLSLACLLTIGFSYHFFSGLSVFIGAAWGCANLFLIKRLVERLFILHVRYDLKLYLLIGLKFPLLYFVGYLCLKIDCLANLNLLLGFSLILVVIFLKGLGNSYLTKT